MIRFEATVDGCEWRLLRHAKAERIQLVAKDVRTGEVWVGEMSAAMAAAFGSALMRESLVVQATQVLKLDAAAVVAPNSSLN